jgi:hypothetical protein
MKTLDHRFRSAKTDGPDASQVQPSHWNDAHAFSGGANGNALVRDTTDAAYGATWAPLGKWIAVPFAVGNFGELNGSWVVPGVQVQRYTLLGATMRYHVYIPASTATGVSGIAIGLPTGYSMTSQVHDTALYIDSVGPGIAQLYASPGETSLKIVKFAGFFATGNLEIYLSVTLEVAGPGVTAD